MHFKHFDNQNQCLKNPLPLSLFNKFNDYSRSGKQKPLSMTFPGRGPPEYSLGQGTITLSKTLALLIHPGLIIQ